jgi:N-acetylmuramoyl-L-alanine amidase
VKLIQHPSPNWNRRPCAVDAVVLHATADRDTAVAVDWCCTPKTRNPNPVSYHAIVDRDATVYHLVDTANRAWHAGVSSFAGRSNCNDYSIGLSFANVNDGHEPYAEAQLAVGAALVAEWIRKYPLITLDRITTHAVVRAEWRRTHPDAEVKTDPAAPAFDMDDFRARVVRELAR